jgi:uncharacterized protein YbjT (DUF2867 family)
MKTILVTGATGKQGGAVARALLANGHAVRAMTRNPGGAAAQALATLGATVVRGNLDNANSLREAMSGAWGVFAVQNSWEAGVEAEEVQGKRQARVAREVGVQHYVYSSVGSAEQATGIPHFDNKWRVEEEVRSLGFSSHVILRPVFFMENLNAEPTIAGIGDGALALGISPDTRLQMVAVEQIGAYALRAFEHPDELDGRALGIAGDEVTAPEAAALIAGALGHDVTHFQVPIEDVRAWSDDFALMLEWFDEVGYDVDIEGSAAEHGIAPVRLADWVGAADWSAAQRG